MHLDLLDLLRLPARALRVVPHGSDAAILLGFGALLLLLGVIEARHQRRRRSRESVACQYLACGSRHPRSAMRTVRVRGQASAWCPAHDLDASGAGPARTAA
jgi:hypothetical protein